METARVVDWESQSNEILLNPRMPVHERAFLTNTLKGFDQLQGHVWLATSGSSGFVKCVALSKKAILLSAAAVNRHLHVTSADRWLNPLPIFHVGGLGIWARSHLSGAKMFISNRPKGRWDPCAFVEQTKTQEATLTALVPAQVYDLVSQNLTAPSSLRAAIVGGGALSENIYFEAIARGWKLLPSYGLTECASQVATASLDSWQYSTFPHLIPLDHVQLATNEHGTLKIKSPSLLTAYAYPDPNEAKSSLIDPKEDGWFTTEDHVVIENGAIKSISRDHHFVKIGGESVDLLRLENILDAARLALQIKEDVALFAAQDQRLGHAIHLAIAAAPDECQYLHVLLDHYHARVHPFEKIRKVHHVSEIPRTPLNKIIVSLLKKGSGL